MKKTYVTMKLVVIQLSSDDCVRTSGVGVRWNEGWSDFFEFGTEQES